MAVRERASVDMNAADGGANRSAFTAGIGLGDLGMGVTVADPLCWIGVGAATSRSCFGGPLINDGSRNHGLIRGEHFH